MADSVFGVARDASCFLRLTHDSDADHAYFSQAPSYDTRLLSSSIEWGRVQARGSGVACASHNRRNKDTISDSSYVHELRGELNRKVDQRASISKRVPVRAKAKCFSDETLHCPELVVPSGEMNFKVVQRHFPRADYVSLPMASLRSLVAPCAGLQVDGNDELQAKSKRRANFQCQCFTIKGDHNISQVSWQRSRRT